jgi:hypothetical protein
LGKKPKQGVICTSEKYYGCRCWLNLPIEVTEEDRSQMFRRATDAEKDKWARDLIEKVWHGKIPGLPEYNPGSSTTSAPPQPTKALERKCFDEGAPLGMTLPDDVLAEHIVKFCGRGDFKPAKGCDQRDHKGKFLGETCGWPKELLEYQPALEGKYLTTKLLLAMWVATGSVVLDENGCSQAFETLLKSCDSKLKRNGMTYRYGGSDDVGEDAGKVHVRIAITEFGAGTESMPGNGSGKAAEAPAGEEPEMMSPPLPKGSGLSLLLPTGH